MTEPLTDIVSPIEIQAPMAAVWSTMTRTDAAPGWLGCLEYRAAVGHVFYMQPDADKRARGDLENATHCEILELTEPSTFRFSWYLPGMPSTTVTLSLEPAGDERTRVTLRHAGWDRFPPDAIRGIREALEQGWSRAVLPSLKRAVE